MNQDQPTVPIVETPSSRVGNFILFRLPFAYLRRILATIRTIRCLMECHGEIVTAEVAVTTALAPLRPSDRLARRTAVINAGSATVLIYESGVLIYILPPGQSVTLPAESALALSAQTASGTSSLIVSTHRRCLCGDPEEYAEADPVGGDLI